MGRPRCALYARCSTAKDQHPELQLEILRKYCQARDWEVAREFVDQGFSGGTDNRPALRELLKLVRQREVDAVIVLKLDRLFRSLKHLILTIEEFDALGVQFVAVKDNVDWTTAAGRMFVQVLAALAEFEKELIRERTLLGLAHARSRGKTLGRPKKSPDHRVLELRQQGMSYRKIAATLKISDGAVWHALKAAQRIGVKNAATNAEKMELQDE